MISKIQSHIAYCIQFTQVLDTGVSLLEHLATCIYIGIYVTGSAKREHDSTIQIFSIKHRNTLGKKLCILKKIRKLPYPPVKEGANS